MKINNRIIGICAFAISLLSVCVFLDKFLLTSDFSWTFMQREVINAVLEILIILILFVIIFSLKICIEYRLLLLFAGLLSVAFLHSFLWALLAGLIYVSVTIHAGNIICRGLKIESNIHSSFLSGFVAVIVLVALLSCFRVGTPHHLRSILPFFMIAILILDKKQIAHNRERFNNIGNEIGGIFEDNIGFWSFAFSIAAFCILIGKANYCTDYDSLWYGLKSEYVLAPFTGIYDNINLIAAVYTYPKGFEIYTLFWAGLRSYSFIISINVVIWILTCHVMIDIVKEFGVFKNKENVVCMLLMLTPSITNLVNTAKPDILSLYFQLVGVLFCIRGIKAKKQEYWYISLSALLITFAIKPTAILYSSLLLIIIIVFRLMERGSIVDGVQTLCIPVIGCTVVFSRTALITGLPMTSLIVSMLTDIGFRIKYPYVLNSSRVTSLNDLLSKDLLLSRISRLLDLFFYPNTGKLVTTERTWWGMLFSILWIIAVGDFLIHIKKRIKDIKTDRLYGIVNTMFFIISAASVGTMLLLDYPDGNYYMFMNAITYIYIIVSFRYDIRSMYGLVTTLIAENMILSIVISCAWSVGFTPLSLRNLGYYDHTSKYKEVIANNFGIRDIYDYMKDNDDSRTLFLSTREDEMLVLPGINELYSHQKMWGNYVFESEEAFEQFLTYTGTNYLLADNTIENETVYPVLIKMEREGEVVPEYAADGFTLYKVEAK